MQHGAIFSSIHQQYDQEDHHQDIQDEPCLQPQAELFLPLSAADRV